MHVTSKCVFSVSHKEKYSGEFLGHSSEDSYLDELVK